ncbi:hypothetical protein [Novosphingobium gossypii]|uniref:hypothetical protein n=1 Tax=Novosphingobium gossypii TaxID=1604774 RepID=UPI003D25B4AE
MISRSLLLMAVLGLAACDGPHERAGKKQDEAAATAAGMDYTGSGPAERAGEVQDKADAAAAEARDASADALKADARNLERQADVEAEKLEARADQLRDAAEKKADGLKREADQLRKTAQ